MHSLSNRISFQWLKSQLTKVGRLYVQSILVEPLTKCWIHWELDKIKPSNDWSGQYSPVRITESRDSPHFSLSFHITQIINASLYFWCVIFYCVCEDGSRQCDVAGLRAYRRQNMRSGHLCHIGMRSWTRTASSQHEAATRLTEVSRFYLQKKTPAVA